MLFKRLMYLISSLSLLSSTIACNSGEGWNGLPGFPTPPLTINSVDLINQTDLSMTIHFTADNNISNWKLGFYMPFTFKKASWWNPNLILQICNESSPSTYSDCSDLNYDENRTPAVATTYDTSAGWTTVFSVDNASPFQTLQNGRHYVIQALHNSLGIARNYSSYPQNFFAIVNGSVINLNATTTSMYNVSDYNQQTIDAENAQHVYTNWVSSLKENPAINIVPSPVSYANGVDGNFVLQNGVTVHNSLNPNDNTVANFFKADLASDIQINATVDNNALATGIILRTIAEPGLINNNPEGYQISVGQSAITIEALTNAGAFYALQTLRQLWMSSHTMNSMKIVDYPRFTYRGLGIDSARHFVSVDDLKTMLDVMALQKLNTLHLRIADDEGWRLALAAYPELTSIGANRGYGNTLGNTMIGSQLTKQANFDLISGSSNSDLYATATDIYTGTYSMNDIAELLVYANNRQITIIPEIDIPGHARALVKSLPAAFFDPNDQSDFASVQGFSDNVLPVCTYNTGSSLGSNFTHTINDIVTQIAAAFNNQTTLYALNQEISIGADEVNGSTWTNDSSCTGNWLALNALGKSQYFSQLLSNANPQLKISGWQQLVQNDDVTIGTHVVPATQTGHVYVWSSATPGISQAISLANHHYPTVLAFSDQLYFDLTYNKDKTELGQYWATSYADTQAALSSASSATASVSGTTQPHNIAGLEGELWGENLVTFADLTYMATPKMAGLSEAAWSSASVTMQAGQVNWQSLASRLGCGKQGFLATLNKLTGIAYRGYPNGISLEVPSGRLCN